MFCIFRSFQSLISLGPLRLSYETESYGMKKRKKWQLFCGPYFFFKFCESVCRSEYLKNSWTLFQNCFPVTITIKVTIAQSKKSTCICIFFLLFPRTGRSSRAPMVSGSGTFDQNSCSTSQGFKSQYHITEGQCHCTRHPGRKNDKLNLNYHSTAWLQKQIRWQHLPGRTSQEVLLLLKHLYSISF